MPIAGPRENGSGVSLAVEGISIRNSSLLNILFRRQQHIT